MSAKSSSSSKSIKRQRTLSVQDKTKGVFIVQSYIGLAIDRSVKPHEIHGKVHWKNFDDSKQDTWEPISNLILGKSNPTKADKLKTAMDIIGDLIVQLRQLYSDEDDATAANTLIDISRPVD
jgi:hypothetical protein